MNKTTTKKADLREIRWKLTRRYSLITGSILLIFGVAVYAEVIRTRTILLREQARQLASSAAGQLPLILHESEEYDKTKRRGTLAEAGKLSVIDSQSISHASKKILIFNKHLKTLSHYGSMKVDPSLLIPTGTRDQRQDLSLPNGVAYWRPVYLRKTHDSESSIEGYVLSIISTHSADREMTRLGKGLLVGGSAAAMAAAALSQWMVSTSLKPIRDQMDRLAQFTADASHELRHPLTAIRAVLGGLRERGLLDAIDPYVAQKIDLVDQATTEMTHLVEDLLLLTRLDQALPDKNHWVQFDLSELIEDLLALYQDRASNQHVHLRSSIEQHSLIKGNPDQIRRLISNLLVNALQYTPENRGIDISVSQESANIVIRVEDEGKGIAPEHRSLIFERFWQAETARSSPTAGLGLSIVRSIASVHGGSVEAQAGRSGGCRIVVHLPAAS